MKKAFPLDLADAFLNALQLSIQSKVGSIVREDTETKRLLIIFEERIAGDSQLAYFQRIVGGEFAEDADKTLIVDDAHVDHWPLLLNFLMLTRLNPENMRQLAADDPAYRPFILMDDVETSRETALLSSADAGRAIFQTIAAQGLTLREVSRRTGLTQTMLSKFKAGNDIRLSSLLKIARSLGLKVTIA